MSEIEEKSTKSSMSAKKHSLQTPNLARFGSFHIYIYIYDLVFVTFLIFILY